MDEANKELAVMSETPKLSQVAEFFNAERLNQMHKLATYFHQAQCFGQDVKNPQQALVKIQAGLEMGMAPMEAMNSLYIVNGKLTIYGSAMTKRLRLKGWKIQYDEKPDECKVTITKGHEIHDYTATAQELRELKSKAATFALRDKLRWHAVSRLIRFYVPEVLEAGIGFYEEEVDNEVPGVKVLDVSQAPIMGVEEIVASIAAAQTLEDLQQIAERADKLSAEDAKAVREALIKKRSEVGRPSGGADTVKKRKEVQDIIDQVQEAEIIEPEKPDTGKTHVQEKEVDEEPKKEVQKTPAPEKQPMDYWTFQKIQSVVGGLTTSAELHGLKDDFNRFIQDGEVTQSVYDFAIKNIQTRLNQITKKKREDAEQTSIS